MNKTALKNFAMNARKELIEKVKAKAFRIGIIEESIKKSQLESSDAIYIDGKQLSVTEKKQREKLISRIKEIGYSQVIEEVAHTWFNRFTALRFMEVNNYLPTKVRVLSSSNPDSSEPDIIKDALTVDLDIDKELVYDLKLNNKTEELFKYLIIKQCNSLNNVLPFMFETIEDYKEILFPDGLLAKDSFLLEMTDTEVISDSDWEQVEIIGWLYQYYNTEINEIVYNGDMNKTKVTKQLLPAATQLFTPDWAVQYMVENSLGRLWMETHCDSDLKINWNYYLAVESNSKDDMRNSLIKNEKLNPEMIKLFDPCMGSGHILVYAFEVLMQIYESCGYTQREAAKLILQKNLYGIDIDDRAYQLACFALFMKARKYNRRILDERLEHNLCTIMESNELNKVEYDNDFPQLGDKEIETAKYLISVYYDAKEYGSILHIEERDYKSLVKSLSEMVSSNEYDLFQLEILNRLIEILPKLAKQAEIMSQKYDIVITNPPYLGNGRMSPLLNEYVKTNYSNTKSDLSMVMYEKIVNEYSKPEGYISLITTNSWMFLESFENMRNEMLRRIQFDTFIDFGTELFDGKVGHNPIVSWVNKNSIPKTNMTAIRLVEFCYSRRDQKKSEFFNLENRFSSNQNEFSKIPGSPFAYWANKKFVDIFEAKKVSDYYEVKSGIMTGKDPVHLKLWYEVNYEFIGFNCKDASQMSDYTWFPINKGGEYRSYYGNNDYVINLKNNGEKIKNTSTNYRLRDKKRYFGEGITWSRVTSSSVGFRENKSGTLFGDAGPIIFVENEEEKYYLLGLLTSKVIHSIMKFINPTLNYQVRDVEALPLISDYNSEIIRKVKENVAISKFDWDASEISYDFMKHPIMKIDAHNNLIRSAFDTYNCYIEEKYQQLKSNAEDINRYFIELYALQGELNAEVSKAEISIDESLEIRRTMKSFISYAVGCALGRYSLDKEGLIFAGGEFNDLNYEVFSVVSDNIIPVLDGSYFDDDIVSIIIEFVKVTFGNESLIENLEYIANSIGKKDEETIAETIRRYMLNDFFKDHLQTYKKKPIYWLFTSGKQKAFNCLIYMHRYDKSTLSRIRTDYLHELQIRMDAEKKILLDLINGDGTTKEIANAKKELKSLDLKIEELRAYDEKLHHMADMQIEIDLDDGVAVNYAKFEGLLAPIK
ncbi:BREX-1 system adenine-specific DNA-methyltransferase PglX [Paenibacillus sp. FSL L8-0708]|uniref:BREX-1 system adenine-specific DNA-methyltransferase PglX n=1 Tax=Paenibacillus sp. FSL L8-0708 TaxID=2975311 RepID=UPI0030F77D11